MRAAAAIPDAGREAPSISPPPLIPYLRLLRKAHYRRSKRPSVTPRRLLTPFQVFTFGLEQPVFIYLIRNKNGLVTLSASKALQCHCCGRRDLGLIQPGDQDWHGHGATEQPECDQSICSMTLLDQFREQSQSTATDR